MDTQRDTRLEPCGPHGPPQAVENTWCRSRDSNPDSPAGRDFKGVRRGQRIKDFREFPQFVALSRLRGVRGVLYSPRVMDTQMETRSSADWPTDPREEEAREGSGAPEPLLLLGQD